MKRKEGFIRTEVQIEALHSILQMIPTLYSTEVGR
jgi:hypothetical protein